jgi:MtN3 and saliva related transmembrane protein
MQFWVSALAAILTTTAFVPQALHIIRYKETKAISLLMYVAFASGVALWLLFGILIHNWPIMISNAITLALNSTIVAMKLRYG